MKTRLGKATLDGIVYTMSALVPDDDLEGRIQGAMVSGGTGLGDGTHLLSWDDFTRHGDMTGVLLEPQPLTAVYLGAFLDGPARQALLTWWSSTTSLDNHPRVEAHHMTLAFNPSPERIAQVHLGEEVLLRPVLAAWTDSIQVVRVEGDHPLGGSYAPLVDSGLPHITISLADGAQPKLSLGVLRGIGTAGSGVSDLLPTSPGPLLRARIGIFTSGGRISYQADLR